MFEGVILVDFAIGRKFGFLTVIKKVGKNKSYNTLYECLCDCGKTKIVTDTNLTSGNTKSCGCMKEALKVAAMGDIERLSVEEKLTVKYIKNRIEELRKSIEHLRGKTPDVMNKVEYLAFYTINSRIIELQDLIRGE